MRERCLDPPNESVDRPGACAVCAHGAGDRRRVVVARRAGRAAAVAARGRAKSSIASPMRHSATARIRWSRPPRCSRQQIDEDLALLSKYTDCVRTYSIEDGLDQVPEIAQRHGLKVLQGLWLSSDRAKNRGADRHHHRARQTISRRHPRHRRRQRGAAARRNVGDRSRRHHPRGQSAGRRSRSPMRTSGSSGCAIATCRTRSISSPSISCRIGRIFRSRPRGRGHVDAIRSQVAAAFPNKEILIGEFGWPSAGRMREGALPSPSNQARAIEETLALAQAREFPGQRHRGLRSALEALARRIGRRLLGHFRPRDRRPKFTLGGAVSDHPHWLLQRAGRHLAGRVDVRRRVRRPARQKSRRRMLWPQDRRARVPARRAVRLDHRDDPGRELQRRRLAAFARLRRCCRGRADRLRGRPARRAAAADLCRASRPLRRAPRRACLGRSAAFIALVLFAVQAALGLVFDPRYRDFQFAPLTAAVVPFLVLCCSMPRPVGRARHGRAGRGRGAARCRPSTSCSTKASPIGRRCGSAPALLGLASFWRGRGTRQA